LVLSPENSDGSIVKHRQKLNSLRLDQPSSSALLRILWLDGKIIDYVAILVIMIAFIIFRGCFLFLWEV